MSCYPTLVDVKDYFDITDPTYDDQLTLILSWTSALIEAYLGRALCLAETTQTLYKPQTVIAQLDNYPGDSITEVEVDGNIKPLEDYHLVKRIGTVYGDFFSATHVNITYMGGYTELPAVISDVFYSIVGDRYETLLGASDADIKDVTLFDFAKVSYDTSGSSGSSSLSYQGVGSGTVPEPLQDYLGMLDLYKSNNVLLGADGVG